jgi:hypothetical protein
MMIDPGRRPWVQLEVAEGRGPECASDSAAELTITETVTILRVIRVNHVHRGTVTAHDSGGCRARA